MEIALLTHCCFSCRTAVPAELGSPHTALPAERLRGDTASGGPGAGEEKRVEEDYSQLELTKL